MSGKKDEREIESRAATYPLARFRNRRRPSLRWVPACAMIPQKCHECDPGFPGTMSRARHWTAICAGLPALLFARELEMRNRILAIAAISGALAAAGVLAAPVAAQAQSTVTTGAVRSGSVAINEDEGITAE